MAIDFDSLLLQLSNLGFKFYDPADPSKSTLGFIISQLIAYIFAAAGILLLLYFLWGGFQLMLSRGDPKAIESGKAKITGGLIGFVIVFTAYWLIQLLSSLLGITKIIEIFQ